MKLLEKLCKIVSVHCVLGRVGGLSSKTVPTLSVPPAVAVP